MTGIEWLGNPDWNRTMQPRNCTENKEKISMVHPFPTSFQLSFLPLERLGIFGISNLKQTRNILTYSFPFKLREKELTRFPLVFP
jgi:hypothetical protein